MPQTYSTYEKPHLVETCRVCKLVKPLSDFSKDKSRASGYKSLCKDCWNGYMKDRRAEVGDAKRLRISRDPNGERRLIDFDKARERALRKVQADEPILAQLRGLHSTVIAVTLHSQALRQHVEAIAQVFPALNLQALPDLPPVPDIVAFVEERRAANAKELADASVMHDAAQAAFDAGVAQAQAQADLRTKAHADAHADAHAEELAQGASTPTASQLAQGTADSKAQPDPTPQTLQVPDGMPKGMPHYPPKEATEAKETPEVPDTSRYAGLTSAVNVVDADDEIRF